MREFFRGWRRKIGVMTLVVACVFMAGWVRSCTTEDDFESDSIYDYQVTIGGGQIIWWRIGAKDGVRNLQSKRTWRSRPLNWRLWPEASQTSGWDILTQYNVPGFSLKTGRRLGESTLVFGVASISWIVVPLTMLSAYLLLSNPRTRKPPESTKPPDEAQVTHA
jgi:hypothetical protein